MKKELLKEYNEDVSKIEHIANKRITMGKIWSVFADFFVITFISVVFFTASDRILDLVSTNL